MKTKILLAALAALLVALCLISSAQGPRNAKKAAAAFNSVGCYLFAGHGVLLGAGPFHGQAHVILGRCGHRQHHKQKQKKDMTVCFHGLQR